LLLSLFTYILLTIEFFVLCHRTKTLEDSLPTILFIQHICTNLDGAIVPPVYRKYVYWSTRSFFGLNVGSKSWLLFDKGGIFKDNRFVCISTMHSALGCKWALMFVNICKLRKRRPPRSLVIVPTCCCWIDALVLLQVVPLSPPVLRIIHASCVCEREGTIEAVAILWQ
jgi:hypothetical protein